MDISVVIRGINDGVLDFIELLKRNGLGSNINIICKENEKIGEELDVVIHHYSGKIDNLLEYEKNICIYDNRILFDAEYEVSEELLKEIISTCDQGRNLAASSKVTKGDICLEFDEMIFMNDKNHESILMNSKLRGDFNSKKIEGYIYKSFLQEKEENIAELLKISDTKEILRVVEKVKIKNNLLPDESKYINFTPEEYRLFCKKNNKELLGQKKIKGYEIPKLCEIFENTAEASVDIIKPCVENKNLDPILDVVSKEKENFKENMFEIIQELGKNREVDSILAEVKLAEYFIENFFDKNTPKDKRLASTVFERYIDSSIYLINNNFYKSKGLKNYKFIAAMDEVAGEVINGSVENAIMKLKKMQISFKKYNYILQLYIQQLIVQKKRFLKKISICMIVKNEEKNLNRCFDSMLPLLKREDVELIVVDTGSTDRTVEILKQYPCRVEHFKWTGHFSDARNYSMLFAEGEFIFIMDADEEFENREMKKLLKVIDEDGFGEYNTYALNIINYNDNEGRTYSEMVQPLIFKNDGDFHYKGLVHNQPMLKGPLKSLDVGILHYGYIMEGEIKERKFKRTATLLKKTLSEKSDSMYNRYQLATSYSMYGDFYNAERHSNILYAMIQKKWETFFEDPNMLFVYAVVSAKMNNGKYREAIEVCEKGEELLKDYIDLWNYKGVACLCLKRYEKAIESFEQYFRIYKNKENYDYFKDTRLLIYSLADYENNLKRLMYLYYENNRYEELQEFYQDLDEEERNDPYLRNLFIRSLLISGKFSKLEMFFCKNESDSQKNKVAKLIKEIIINDKSLSIGDMNGVVSEEFFSRINKVKISEGVYLNLSGVKIKDLEVDSYNYLKDNMVTFIESNEITMKSDSKLIRQYIDVLEYMIYAGIGIKIQKISDDVVLEYFQKYCECLKILSVVCVELLEESEIVITELLLDLSESEFASETLKGLRILKDICEINKKISLVVNIYIKERYSNISEISAIERQMITNKKKRNIRMLIENGEIERAREEIIKFEMSNDIDLEFIYVKGLWFIASGDYEGAFDVFSLGLQYDKYSYYFNYEVANIYSMIGEKELAEESLQKASVGCADKKLKEKLTKIIKNGECAK